MNGTVYMNDRLEITTQQMMQLMSCQYGALIQLLRSRLCDCDDGITGYHVNNVSLLYDLCIVIFIIIIIMTYFDYLCLITEFRILYLY